VLIKTDTVKDEKATVAPRHIVLGHLAANLPVVLMTVIRAAVFQVKALRFPIVLSIIPFNNAIDILPKTRSQICNSGSLLG